MRWLHGHDVVRDVLLHATLPIGSTCNPTFRLLFVGSDAAIRSRGVVPSLRQFAVSPVYM